MTELVSVTFSNHWRDRRDRDPEKHRDYVPGETADVDADLAKRFVRAGTAIYSTKSDADAAGEPDAVTASTLPADEKPKKPKP